jgi:hypothetical protein
MYLMVPYNFSPVVQFIQVFVPTAQPFTPQVPMVIPQPVNQQTPLEEVQQTLDDLPKAREPITRTHFSEEDDERLLQIMEGRPRPLMPGKWKDIAFETGKFSPRQCRERWQNYLKPSLSRTDFTIAERREVLKQSIRYYGQWQVIASKIGNGTNRSPQMIKNLLTNLISKMTKLGIIITEPEDVDCIPEIAFHRVSLSPQQVRQSFELAKLARFRPNPPTR